MSVGFINSSCTQLPLLFSGGTHAAAWYSSTFSLGLPFGRSGRRIRADTSREGCGFPWFVLGITRFCGWRSLTKARLATHLVGIRPLAGNKALGFVYGQF